MNKIRSALVKYPPKHCMECCFESVVLLINGFDTLRTRCVDGIIAKEALEKSLGVYRLVLDHGIILVICGI